MPMVQIFGDTFIIVKNLFNRQLLLSNNIYIYIYIYIYIIYYQFIILIYYTKAGCQVIVTEAC